MDWDWRKGTIRTDLLLDNLSIILRTLTTLPTSQEARDITQRALNAEARVRDWSKTPPTPHEREAIMILVLSLRKDLAKLERTDTD